MKINKNDQKKLEAALHQLEIDLAKSEQKIQKKYARIQAPFTLQEALSSLTKDELSDIRRLFNVPRASQLKKAELVDTLVDYIPVKIEERLKNWDKERLDYLIQACNNNGVLTLEQLELDIEKEVYFASTGFFFMCHLDGQHVIAIPTDLIEPLKKLAEQEDIQTMSKLNTEIIKLTHGLCYYYGVLPMDKINQLLSRYAPITDYGHYFRVIHEAIDYYEKIQSVHQGFSHYLVDNIEEVLQQQKSRVGLDYYPFTKEELLQAGEPNYVEKNLHYQQMVSLLIRHFELNEEEADMMVEEITIAAKNGITPNEMISKLSNELEIQSEADIHKLAHTLIELMNHTRVWFLKGYTSVELRPNPGPKKPKPNNVISFQTGKKIGRNELCPCGSGKKYKKCCGY
ncbi:YecA family protein [Bacillus sp. JCM 19034]|uniref:YecA family protein n=1 Tax=Bacillus sp. JCM 19034 TaxID=1481928 RepID=UPI0007836886|nr:SEC-C domain-containing protein [Bacillus sp. JCM 19034]